MEADNKSLLDKSSMASGSSFVVVSLIPDSDSESEESEAYFIDRRYLSDQSKRKVSGYGARSSVRKRPVRRTVDKKFQSPP